MKKRCTKISLREYDPEARWLLKQEHFELSRDKFVEKWG